MRMAEKEWIHFYSYFPSPTCMLAEGIAGLCWPWAGREGWGFELECNTSPKIVWTWFVCSHDLCSCCKMLSHHWKYGTDLKPVLTVSVNHWGWKALLKIVLFSKLEQAAQDGVQAGFDHKYGDSAAFLATFFQWLMMLIVKFGVVVMFTWVFLYFSLFLCLF